MKKVLPQRSLAEWMIGFNLNGATCEKSDLADKWGM
jgi:hypothetical protein